MTEIKLTKRYPQSRTEDIVDAYMRGWNDALDAVQNGKFIINDDRKTENSSEKPNSCEDEPQTTDYCDVCNHKGCDNCVADGSNPYCVPSHYEPKDEPTISKMEQVDKDINVRSKDEPQTGRSE